MNKNPEDYSRDKRGAGYNPKTFLRNNLIDNQSSFYRSLALFLAVPVIGDILVYILAKLLVKKMY